MMIQRLTLKDCAVKIHAYLDQTLTADDLIAWSREAMMAVEIAPEEHEKIMALLQDISMSTPETLRQAIRHYKNLAKIQNGT